MGDLYKEAPEVPTPDHLRRMATQIEAASRGLAPEAERLRAMARRWELRAAMRKERS